MNLQKTVDIGFVIGHEVIQASRGGTQCRLVQHIVNIDAGLMASFEVAYIPLNEPKLQVRWSQTVYAG